MNKSYRRTAYALPTLLVLLAGLASYPLHAQSYLQVLDPQQPWRSFQGTIEEATFSVRPKGVYMEVGMYLTFSARGSDFANHDSVEVEFYFNLPKEAVVTDSWLWVEDIIIRADIKDIWTAEDIYEDIVRRRRDPSILYKRGPEQYELRIFPMAGNETRKVKITYQVPTLWTARTVSAALPTQLLQASWHTLPNVSLLTWPDETWQNPQLVEEPGREFIEQINHLGTFREADLPGTDIPAPLTLAFDTPLKDGLFLSRLPDGDESWYQLAMLPSASLGLSARRKVALLFDYDAGKTTLSQAEVINAAKSLLQTSLTPADSFNLIVSQLDIRRADETWLPATPAAIEAAFDALGENPMTEYSNLPSLLANGVNFIKTQGPGGSLLLLSSAEQVGEAQVADRLIRDLRTAAGTLPPIHVVDYTNRNYAWYYINGQSFQGNGYFYTSIARTTGGTYLNVRDTGAGLSELLATSFTALGGTISAFDLYTTLRFGFCFGRFTSTEAEQVVFIDRAILQVGKCLGDFPFMLEASGVFTSAPFSQAFEIAEQDVVASDTTLTAQWTGRHIRNLEGGTQTNDIINEIISYSLDERVLSFYTAFLALDPSQGGQECTECTDETGGNPTPIEEETPVPDEVVLSAYPNPFHTTVTIDVTLPEPLDVADLTFQVYDVMGRVVKTLHPDASGLLQELTLTWDGTNDAGQQVASGTYFFVMTTPNGRHTISLVLVR